MIEEIAKNLSREKSNNQMEDGLEGGMGWPMWAKVATYLGLLVFLNLHLTGALADVSAQPTSVEIQIDQWSRLVSGVGFPIAVAMYLLIRMEKVIAKLTDAVSKLATVLAQKGIHVD